LNASRLPHPIGAIANVCDTPGRTHIADAASRRDIADIIGAVSA
jgi:hypothetical protein